MLTIMVQELEMLCQKNRLLLIVILVASLIYTLLIGNLYRNGSVQNIPVVVADVDGSAASREIIKALQETDKLNLRAVYSYAESAENAVQSRFCEVALVIPPDYSQRRAKGESVKLLYLVDGSNVLHASYASEPMQTAINSINAQYRREQNVINGYASLATNPVHLSVRMVQNSTQSYLSFYLYGIVCTAAQFSLMLVFGSSIFAAKSKFSDKLRDIIQDWLAREILYLLLSILAISMGLLCCYYLWELPLRMSLGSFFLIYISFAFCVLNLTGVVAMLLRDNLRLVQCFVLYTLPAFLLSGYIWPEEGMVWPVKMISHLLPLHYVLPELRALALGGEAAGLEHNSLLLLLAGVTMLLLNLYLSIRKQAKS